MRWSRRDGWRSCATARSGTFGVLALALSVLIKVACLAQFSGSTGLVVLIAATRCRAP
jgi:cobalamin synthase